MTTSGGPDEPAPALPLGDDGGASDARAGRAGLAVACAGAFVFGLDLGWLSTAALLGGAAWQLVRSGRSEGLVRAGLAPGLLLLLTLGSYYAISVGHGQYDPLRAVTYLVICLLAYLAGLTAMGPRDAEQVPDALVLFVFAATGSALYAVLSASQGLQTGQELLIRAAPSIWNPADLITATALGAAAVPGLALLAAAAFSTREERALPLRLILLAAASMGATANALLLNRSPFLALAAALGWCAWLWLRDPGLAPGIRWSRMAWLASGGAIAVAASFALLGDADVGILARFESEGLSTGRYEVWWEVLSQLLVHPLGGRAFPISENFAHNLWLDVGYDAGPFPFLLLLAFHAMHLPAALAVVRGHPSITARGITVAALAAFGLTAMAEPVLIMSVPHFALGLLFLGGLRRAADALAQREQVAGDVPEGAAAGEPVHG